MTNIKKGLSLFLALLTLLTITLSPIGLTGVASADSGGDVLENEDITSEEANDETSAEDIDTNFEFTDIDDSSEADKEKPMAATPGVSGIAGGISPFANGLITDLSAGTKLDINTLYGLKDGNWTIRADGYFIQADDLVPILDSVTEIFTNYVKFQNFGHFLIIYNYSDSQGVRTIGPLPVLSPTPAPGANGLTPWGKEVKWDLKELLKDDSGTPFPDKSELYIEVRYAKTSTGQMTPDSAGVILNHEYITTQVTLKDAVSLGGKEYNPTSIDYWANREHGTDASEVKRETTNNWYLYQAGADGKPTGVAIGSGLFDDGEGGFDTAADDYINPHMENGGFKIGGVDYTLATLPSGDYVAVVTTESKTKYGNPISEETANTAFSIARPKTQIDGKDGTALSPVVITDIEDIKLTWENTYDTALHEGVSWSVTGPGSYSQNGSSTTGKALTLKASGLTTKITEPGKYTVTIKEKLDGIIDTTGHETVGTFTMGKHVVEHVLNLPDGTTHTLTEKGVTGLDLEGKPFTTSELTAGTISHDGVDYRIKIKPTTEGGNYTDGTQSFKYIYEAIEKSFVKVEYYTEDSNGANPAKHEEAKWPATTDNEPDMTVLTKGSATPPADHTLNRIEIIAPDGTMTAAPASAVSAKEYLATYPGNTKLLTVKYIYREIPKTNIIVEHVYEDGSPVAVDENFTGYSGAPQVTAKLPGYDIVNTKIDGTPQGSTADITANFPATGSTTITYVYKKPPVAKGNVAEKHYIINADGTFTEITGSAHTHPSSNVGKKVTLVGELKGSSLPAGHTYASANTIATNPTGGSVAITGGVVTVVDGQIVVKYYYTAGETVTPPAGQAVVTVTHTLLDANGNVVGVYKTDGKTGKIGEVFSYSQAPLPGYILVAVPGNQNGSLTSSPQAVEYQYKPDPTLASVAEIHYLVDANGKILEVLGASGKTGNNNDPYSYAKMSGYTLVSVTPNATGNLKVGQSPVVIFKYVKTATVVPPTGSGNTDIWTWITGGSNTVDSSTTPGKDGNTNPQTSDNTNQSYALNILISTLVVSLIVLVFVYFLPKKKKEKDN